MKCCVMCLLDGRFANISRVEIATLRRNIYALHTPEVCLCPYAAVDPHSLVRPGAGSAGPICLGCSNYLYRRRPDHQSGWLSSLLVARERWDAPEHRRRESDHVYADGPRQWRDLYVCGHGL